MTPEARAETERYYTESVSWATAQSDALRASRKVAWIVAGLMSLIALCALLAIVMLLPLRTVVPYTLLVDRQTGYVQALDPVNARKIAPDAALTQSFLVQYVIAREGFDRATVQNDFRRVALWSADRARSDYETLMPATNPDSPLVRLPRRTTIEVRVRSVSPLEANTALVRFETVLRDQSGTAQRTQGWVAIVGYRYSSAPMSIEDRFINPLGFQVVRYRRNAETAPVAEPSMPARPTMVIGDRADSSVVRSNSVVELPPTSTLPPVRVRP